MNLYLKPVVAAALVLFFSVKAEAGAVILQNFQGVSLNDTISLGTGAAPPDSMGAVGPNHFVELVNGAYAVYNKSNHTLAGPIITDKTFWTNAGIPSATVSPGVSDPRIVFDPSSQRWFAAQINVSSTGNQVLVARSETSDPTAGWKAVKFRGNVGFADYPTLGVDATGVYIGTNNFTSGAGGFTGVSLFSIPKTDLLLSTPTTANMTGFENLNTLARGFTLQGVNDFGPTKGHGNIYAIDAGLFNVVDQTRIDGAGGPGATLSTTNKFTVTFDGNSINARQPDGTAKIDTLDDRFSAKVYGVGNSIYMANAFAINTGSGLREAVHWLVVNEGTNAILGEGVIGADGYDFFQPSIVANSFGDILLAYNRSGSNSPDGRISSFASIGSTVGGVITFEDPLLLAQGVVDNYHLFHSASDERWGDYSAASVDPNNERRFWTIQEIPLAQSGGGQDRWGTQITEIGITPEPSAFLLTGIVALAVMLRKRRGRPSSFPDS